MILPSGAISKSPKDFGLFWADLSPDEGRFVVTSWAADGSRRSTIPSDFSEMNDWACFVFFLDLLLKPSFLKKEKWLFAKKGGLLNGFDFY